MNLNVKISDEVHQKFLRVKRMLGGVKHEVIVEAALELYFRKWEKKEGPIEVEGKKCI